MVIDHKGGAQALPALFENHIAPDLTGGIPGVLNRGERWEANLKDEAAAGESHTGCERNLES